MSCDTKTDLQFSNGLQKITSFENRESADTSGVKFQLRDGLAPFIENNR